MDGKTFNIIQSILLGAIAIDSSISELQLRPCDRYKDEYKECKSFRGRFQQYFVYGESQSCDQWSIDYNNCMKWSWFENKDAALEVIKSEMKRRDERMQAHLDNTTWTKRDKPPDDWNKPLPDWMAQRNEHTYLAIKAQELRDEEEKAKAQEAADQDNTSHENTPKTESRCSIMWAGGIAGAFDACRM